MEDEHIYWEDSWNDSEKPHDEDDGENRNVGMEETNKALLEVLKIGQEKKPQD